MSDQWFQVLRPNPRAAVRVFGLHYAGGGASWFRTWNDLFPASLELNAIQLPGREGRLREPPLKSVREVVEPLSRAVDGRLDRPYIVYGHSMGALLGFELLRALKDGGSPMPLCFFVSGRQAPDTPQRFAPISGLPDAELIREMGERYRAIPQAVLGEPELLRLMLPTLRADLSIVESYRYTTQQPLGVAISASGGRSDFLVSEEEIKGWSRHTSGPFEMKMHDGGHFFVNDPGPRQALAAKIVQSARGLF